MPPSENPMTSKLIRSSARQKSTQSLVIAANRRRRVARRAADAGIVEQDDLALARQSVRHQGVPVIQGRCQVVEQEQREASRPAEAPIGEPDASDLNEFGGSRFMRSIGHEVIP